MRFEKAEEAESRGEFGRLLLEAVKKYPAAHCGVSAVGGTRRGGARDEEWRLRALPGKAGD